MRVSGGHGQEDTGRCVRGAGVGVPAAFVEVESDLDDGVVVHEPPAHDPVSGHEACQVRTNVDDGTGVVKVSKVGPVPDGRFLLAGST